MRSEIEKRIEEETQNKKRELNEEWLGDVDAIADFIFDNPGLKEYEVRDLLNSSEQRIKQVIAHLEDFDYIYKDDDDLIRLRRKRTQFNPFGTRQWYRLIGEVDNEATEKIMADDKQKLEEYKNQGRPYSE